MIHVIDLECEVSTTLDPAEGYETGMILKKLHLEKNSKLMTGE